MTPEETVTCDRCGTSVALSRTHVAGDPADPEEVEVVCAYCAPPEDRST